MPGGKLRIVNFELRKHVNTRKGYRKFGISIGLVQCIVGCILFHRVHPIHFEFSIAGGL